MIGMKQAASSTSHRRYRMSDLEAEGSPITGYYARQYAILRHTRSLFSHVMTIHMQ